MNGERFREFDDADFSRFRRKVLRTRGGPEQRNFLSALRDDGEFLHAVRSKVITQGSEDPVLYPEAKT